MKIFIYKLIIISSIIIIGGNIGFCQDTKNKLRLSTTDKVTCQGDCSGGEKTCKTITSGNTISCSCTGCTMLVESSIMYKDGSVDPSVTKKQRKYKLAHAKDFYNYMKKHYRDANYQLESCEINKFEGGFTELYSYKINGSNVNSVLFVSLKKDGTLRQQTVVTEYNCTGECPEKGGCKEVYTISTKKVTCNCDKCKLTETKLR